MDRDVNGYGGMSEDIDRTIEDAEELGSGALESVYRVMRHDGLMDIHPENIFGSDRFPDAKDTDTKTDPDDAEADPIQMNGPGIRADDSRMPYSKQGTVPESGKDAAGVGIDGVKAAFGGAKVSHAAFEGMKTGTKAAGAASGAVTAGIGTVVTAGAEAVKKAVDMAKSLQNPEEMPKKSGPILILAVIIAFFFLMIQGAVNALTPASITKQFLHGTGSQIQGVIDFFDGSDESEASGFAGIGTDNYDDAIQKIVEVTDKFFGSIYEERQKEVHALCEDKGYDYELTMESFTAKGNPFGAVNYAALISAYALSDDFETSTLKRFKEALSNAGSKMLEVTYEDSVERIVIPELVYKYVPVHVDGREMYRIQLDANGEYVVDHIITDEKGSLEDTYKEVVYKGETYYVKGEKETVLPEIREVLYGEVTMHPFTEEDVLALFGIDGEAVYEPSRGTAHEITMAEMYQNYYIFLMEETCFSDVAGYMGKEACCLSEDEIRGYLDALPEDTSLNRIQLVKTALALAGAVCYQWGGKPDSPGWNSSWGTPVGNGYDGLDCSGYIKWVFWTAWNDDTYRLMEGTGGISASCLKISEDDLKPGDLGVKYIGGSSGKSTNHVGMYIGTDSFGNRLWAHCNYTDGTVSVNTYGGFRFFLRPNTNKLEDSDYYTKEIVTFGKNVERKEE